MIIATWNLNSVRARRERLLDWLARAGPDVVCLQELKVTADQFPHDEVRQAGYHVAVVGQPTYNGVAILSRQAPEDVRAGLGDGVDDPQARFVAATVGGVRVISAYFPNGATVGSEKWAYKLAWMGRLRAYLERECHPSQPLALCGDFNVATRAEDVANPGKWDDSVLFHPLARAALEEIRAWGLVDVFAAFHPEGHVYSWWDYRAQAFPRDDGLRIDHVFATPVLAARATGAVADRDEREGEGASDHVPVRAFFDEPSPAGLAAGSRGEATAEALSLRPEDSAPSPAAAGPGARRRRAGGKAAAEARERKKLILVDGHSLAYRAFYGLPLYDRRGKASFSTADGEFTNAVYGFASMLIKTWNDERPDYMAVAFDLGRTFRDDLYEDYKGTREKMPEELEPQIGRIVELVEAFGIPTVTAEGFEADDILGTMARRGAAEGLDVLVVTGDTDAFQLIDDHVRVLAPGRLWSDTAIWDPAAIRARYGLEPAQLIDYKALLGDTSDNIPGVRGIGEKTAAPLVQAYGTVEGIYAHLDEVAPPRAKAALEAGREIAALSKRLVTIRTDVPVEIAWDDCAVQRYDRARVERLFDALEFRSIRNRLPDAGLGAEEGPAGEAPAAAPTSGRSGPVRGRQMAMFADEAAARRAAREVLTATTVVTDEAALAQLVAALEGAATISFDVETTSTDPMRAELVGIALATREGAGWYVPVGHADAPEQLPFARVASALGPVLGDPARPKVGHNAKYDMAVLRRAGIEVRGVTFDTMLAEFLIDPDARLGLKALAASRLGVEMTPIAELIGTGRHQITMDLVPLAEAAPYAAADVDMTLRLMHLQSPQLDEFGVRGLLDEVEMPLVPVLIDMELTGVLLDLELLEKMSRRLAVRLVEVEDEVHQLCGMPFNLNSPTQLGDVLFGTLGLSSPTGRKTSTGQRSVAADVLESMQGQHRVIDLVLEHRQLSKVKGTYLDALPRLVHPETGRVHTSFNQTGAVSGRLSSQDPNLQNIPIRTELGREVRQAFIVPPGWKMIAADYSQVELRIVAHISGDPGLAEAFAAGQDIHRATAALVLGISPDMVTDDQRRFAKSINFGVAYGMGAQSLAQQTGKTMKEAKDFIDAYFAGFPNVKRYIDDTKRLAKEQGYVETLLGRRRYFPVLGTETRDARTNILQRAAEREAINHPMQGTAADIIKIAMIRIHDALRAGGYRTRMLLQVHDELVLEAPEDEVEAVAAMVKEIMEGAYPLDPPLKVDVGFGRNWDEVK